jgi:hypothetical protein
LKQEEVVDEKPGVPCLVPETNAAKSPNLVLKLPGVEEPYAGSQADPISAGGEERGRKGDLQKD